MLLDAVHLALFAEVLAPEIHRTHELMATELKGLSPDAMRVIAPAKAAAPGRLKELRDILGLDDTDG